MNKYSISNMIDFSLRAWMGYVLITNSGVGIITPLEELGMPDHIYIIIKGMWDTGFMMHLVKLTELLGGILLITNYYVPLALIALIPVVINIYGFHIFMFDSYLTKGLVMLLICGHLVWKHREIFKPFILRESKPCGGT
jgi:hypothetical protein